jgi:hydrogenase maturation protease
MNVQGRRIVLGIGNILNRDEGVGVHALRELTSRFGPEPDVELVDGGVLGLGLLAVVEECSHLLVLDAVDAGRPPGTVVELAREDIPLFGGVKMSQHQVSFQEVLGLASMRGRLPSSLHLIGVQPGDVSIGLEMSSPAEDAIPDVVERAMAVLACWETMPEAPRTPARETV